MNSMEEDALFKEWGWEKDLIGRRWVSPLGIELSFDDVVDISSGGSALELWLIGIIKQYGKQAVE